MFRWVIHRLASLLPPSIDSDSEQMRFSTTQKRLFLRETRFLFFSTNGPVEFCLRPAHILAGFSGGASLLALFFLSPGLPSLPPVSSLPYVSTVKQLANMIPTASENTEQDEAKTDWTSFLTSPITSAFFNTDPPSMQDKTGLSEPGTLFALNIPAEQSTEYSIAEANTNLLALRQTIIIDPPKYTDIEEPNDELITNPVEVTEDTSFDEANKADLTITEQRTDTIAMPAARPAPEPMDLNLLVLTDLAIRLYRPHR